MIATRRWHDESSKCEFSLSYVGREENFLCFSDFPFLCLLANGCCDWVMEETVFGPSFPPLFDKLCYLLIYWIFGFCCLILILLFFGARDGLTLGYCSFPFILFLLYFILLTLISGNGLVKSDMHMYLIEKETVLQTYIIF